MRLQFKTHSICRSVGKKILVDQYPVESNNINPRTGWPYSDVSLFQLAQRGLAVFDGSRISNLPEVGERVTFDTLSSKNVSTPAEKQAAFMKKFNIKHPEQKPAVVVESVVESAPASVAE